MFVKKVLAFEKWAPADMACINFLIVTPKLLRPFQGGDPLRSENSP